jgi:hypothetical protein
MGKGLLIVTTNITKYLSKNWPVTFLLAPFGPSDGFSRPAGLSYLVGTICKPLPISHPGINKYKGSKKVKQYTEEKAICCLPRRPSDA